MKIRPAFKIHGGKSYISNHIISFFPPNYTEMVYLEPFCGAASVLLNKQPSIEEAVNDLDLKVISIFRCIRDQSIDFVEKLNKINYTKTNFEKALNQKEFKTYLDIAINEFVLRRMSRGGLKKTFSWSDRKRGGKPGDQNAWETIIDIIPQISKRFEKVFAFNKPAIQVIKAYNNKDVLLYADPPYLHETRVSKEAYELELTEDDHIELAGVLNNFKGKAIISGYSSSLYAELYKNWRCEKKKIANHASQKKKKDVKEEIIWLNY